MDIVMDIVTYKCLKYVDIKHVYSQKIYTYEWGWYLTICINCIFKYAFNRYDLSFGYLISWIKDHVVSHTSPVSLALYRIYRHLVLLIIVSGLFQFC